MSYKSNVSGIENVSILADKCRPLLLILELNSAIDNLFICVKLRDYFYIFQFNYKVEQRKILS